MLTAGAWLIRAILIFIGATWRLEIVAGREHLDAVVREKKPHVLTFWHNRTFLASWFVPREMCQRGVDVLALASLSRDGELVSRVAKLYGISVVRGSASRGGTAAVRAIYRAVTRQGSSPAIIPDGPRGPLYEFKIGVVILAQMSQVPILPIGLAASRFFTLKSWDRIIVPWPFSKVGVVIGAPHSVARQLSSEELEDERRRLEGVLNELTRKAEAAFGVEEVTAA